MRSIIAISLLSLVAQTQRAPTLRQPVHPMVFGNIAPRTSIHGRNPSLPSNLDLVKPARHGPSAPRSAPEGEQSALYKAFDERFKPPPSKPKWHKVAEDGQCYEFANTAIP